MKFLESYETVLNEFGSFYNKRYQNISTFVKLPFTYQIGVFIEFLATKDVGIHADRYSIVLYYVYPEAKLKELENLYRDSRSFYIKEEYLDIPNDLLTNYKKAIEYAFAFLEMPY
jgi:hypothetical protein